MSAVQTYLSGAWEGSLALSTSGCLVCGAECIHHPDMPPIHRGCTEYNARNKKRHTRQKAQTAGDQYDWMAVCERDNWTCHLCNAPINKYAGKEHPLSPSIDHIIPVSKGGGDEMNNVRLAHLKCNRDRYNRDLA